MKKKLWFRRLLEKPMTRQKSELENAGFKVEKNEKTSDKASGTVISQSINGGARKRHVGNSYRKQRKREHSAEPDNAASRGKDKNTHH
ncbi:MAG: PASTA domain-containing protein [Clostridiales bacterium]|nr:MAG: PASTA domain-containing protein [Clostridiales bacterium]